MTDSQERSDGVLKRIEAWIERSRGRGIFILTSACVVSAYAWLALGNDLPASEAVLKWDAPVLCASVVGIVLDIHRRLTPFEEPDTFKSKECVHRLLEGLRATARFKYSREKPIEIDLLGVSLHYSHDWIEKDLRQFLDEYPSVCV